MQVISRLVPIGLCALTCVAAGYRPSTIVPPKPPREFRAAWIATVANIDWPSTNATTTAQQKAELVAMLDRVQTLRLNIVIFQVRPACDAMYASSLEPWSEYLTGTMGKAPEPSFDPLSFALGEAHKRDLELHAWFNPYRARHSLAKSPASANHISRTRPELVRRYGKSLWLDPGLPEVQDYSLNVILDVVRRYDVDGVHIDDYFYPYKEKDASGRELDFPDDVSWQRYGAGGKLSREDWRRENVNVFIHRLYDSIKAAKPWVKLGISPFGIWRPGNPPSIQGYDAYTNLYADSRKWMQNGWADYFAPQLYWATDAPQQSFPVLLEWWSAQNKKNRLLAPGLASTKAARPWTPAEILRQISITRKQTGVAGQVHWNMSALMQNTSLAKALQQGPYAEPALTPACTWLRRIAPSRPAVSASKTRSSVVLTITPTGNEPVRLWIVQARSRGIWKTSIHPEERHTLNLDPPEVVAVSALDRYGNLSRAAVLTAN